MIKNTIRKNFDTFAEIPKGYDKIRMIEDTFIASGDDKEPVMYNLLTKVWDKIEVYADYGDKASIKWHQVNFNNKISLFEFTEINDPYIWKKK